MSDPAQVFGRRDLAQLGEEGEAVTRLGEGEQRLDKYAAAGFVGQLGWFYHSLARACLLLGRLDEARRFFRFSEQARRKPGSGSDEHNARRTPSRRSQVARISGRGRRAASLRR